MIERAWQTAAKGWGVTPDMATLLRLLNHTRMAMNMPPVRERAKPLPAFVVSPKVR